jgi:hypothetical protein
MYTYVCMYYMHYMHVCIYCRYLDKTTTNEVERVQEVPMTHEKVRERAKRERGRGQKIECVCRAGTSVCRKEQEAEEIVMLASEMGEKNLIITSF